MADDIQQIDTVREASRRVVRELGFMKPTVGVTGLPISAVHALIEIGGGQGDLTAMALGERLTLEKSSVSRMLRKLVERGEVMERENPRDARSKLLSLTPRGKAMLARIDELGRGQVLGAFRSLSAAQQHLVEAGMATYAEALRAARLGTDAGAAGPKTQIVAGYAPGVIGEVVAMHGATYARPPFGFGRYFEAKVAAELAEFSDRLDRPMNRLWTARRASRVVGSVAIDGEKLGGGNARLRWFIVDGAMRGQGLGRELLTAALAFCEGRQFTSIDLWTLRGLDAARRLYEESGFSLVEEFEGDQWGARVIEQRFRRAAG
jgi:DNA-binding MarR family transcriptional regulator/GNAT superfamily N-acetyltransferase